jgi:hypothetical protein
MNTNLFHLSSYQCLFLRVAKAAAAFLLLISTTSWTPPSPNMNRPISQNVAANSERNDGKLILAKANTGLMVQINFSPIKYVNLFGSAVKNFNSQYPNSTNYAAQWGIGGYTPMFKGFILEASALMSNSQFDWQYSHVKGGAFTSKQDFFVMKCQSASTGYAANVALSLNIKKDEDSACIVYFGVQLDRTNYKKINYYYHQFGDRVASIENFRHLDNLKVRSTDFYFGFAIGRSIRFKLQLDSYFYSNLRNYSSDRFPFIADASAFIGVEIPIPNKTRHLDTSTWYRLTPRSSKKI